MTPGLVSVIIPAYNAAAFVAEALDSVLRQTYPHIEIIVVDDGSTDTTADIVRAYGSRVRLLQQPNSGGCAVPRNTGIHASSGEFLCFFDADDVLLPTKIARQAEFLQLHKEAGIVYGDYRNFTADASGNRSLEPATHFSTCTRLRGLVAGRESVLLNSAQATQLLLRENIGLPSSVMIRRSVLAEVQEFSIDLKSCEDFHFFYRIARRYSLGVVADAGLLRRIHGSNMSGNQRKMLQYQIMSRTQLRSTERWPANLRLLDDYLIQRVLDLARLDADQRAFGASLRHLGTAVSQYFPASLRHAGQACWLLARTLLLAVGLRRSSAP